MERNNRKIGVINWLVFLVSGVAAAVLARYGNSFAGQTASVFFGLGFLVMAVSYFQMRLEEAERLERLEFEELTKTESSSLFHREEAEVFPMRRTREQFERFFVAGFTVLLLMLEGLACFFFWRWLAKPAALELKQPVMVLAWFGAFFLVLFLLGKYSANLARFEKQRLLRPGASYLVLGSYLCVIVAGTIALGWSGIAQADLIVAKILATLLGLLAIENLINLVLEIYRPRVKGKAARLLYESRLVGLLGQPEGIISTVAQALDYQFGFKVSETWFYQFLERALGWLILAQVVLLFLSTCFVFIGPGEEGLLEHFGRAMTLGKPLQPGLHLKWPWPIDRIYTFHTEEIQTFNVGLEQGNNAEPEKTVLWTAKHYSEKEEPMLVASPPEMLSGISTNAEKSVAPVELINVSIPVQYQIKDLRAWAYDFSNAGELLKNIATREVVRYLVSVDLFKIMSSGRFDAVEQLRQLIQKRADEAKPHGLGVKILFVGLQDIHPPVKVAGEFEKVVATLQENEAKKREAEGEAAKTVSLAQAEAKQKIDDAEAYRVETVATAEGQANRFLHQLDTFQAAPAVYTERLYLQTLAAATTNMPRYVLATTNAANILNFNLEENIRPELLNRVTVPPPK